MTTTIEADAATVIAELTPPFTITEPGVYDLTEEQYFGDPIPGGSLSNSGAKKLLAPSCPALYRYYADHEEPHKRHFDFGSAAHYQVLGAGPEIRIIEFDNYLTKDAKEAKKAAYADGATPILRAEYDRVQEMAAAIKAHPLAAALFDPASGKAEQSLFWIDEETGVWRRARLDWLRHRTTVRMISPDYKGLSLDTIIPTPYGSTTMGALSVGDHVFDASGRPCVVTHKSEIHYRTCFRIRFDDASSVICDDEHLWTTTSGRNLRGGGLTTAVRTTDEIRRTLKLYKGNQHRVAIAGVLDLPDVELPVDPYVFGCWLGDGTTAEGSITKPDIELFDLIAARGYSYSHPKPNGACPTRTIYGLRRQLRLAGYLGHKMIPATYLRAGRQQRIDLLRGLMDTDGSWNSTRNQAVFSTTDKALAHAVRDLICGLGQRGVVHPVTQHGFGLTVQAYFVTFSPINGLNPFALSRKADKVTFRPGKISRQRIIVAVEEIPTVPTQCITVDSPDATYLCTEGMIPTHNTSISVEPEFLRKALANHGYYRQAAWYLDGIRALGLADEVTFIFVAQMKTPPYLVTIFDLEDEDIAIGRELNRRAVEVFRDCKASGVWPAFADEPIRLALPTWERRRYEGGEW
jgi:hypothetical protein